MAATKWIFLYRETGKGIEVEDWCMIKIFFLTFLPSFLLSDGASFCSPDWPWIHNPLLLDFGVLDWKYVPSCPALSVV